MGNLRVKSQHNQDLGPYRVKQQNPKGGEGINVFLFLAFYILKAVK